MREPLNDKKRLEHILEAINRLEIHAGKLSREELESDVLRYYGIAKGTVPIVRKEDVLERISFEDLVALVNEPLPKTTVILEYNTTRHRRSDEEVYTFLCETFSLRSPKDLALYSSERIADIAYRAKDFGASIRQLVRLTGISFHHIRIS